MGSNYIGEFVAQEEHEAVEEKEWREREGESIPPWMDEEKITADEYEGEYEGDYEQESSRRIKPW